MNHHPKSRLVSAALRCLPLYAVLLSLAFPLHAQMDEESYGGHPAHGDKALAQYKANQEKYKDNPDVLVLPGLVADRKAQWVDVMAESTGVGAGESAEYLLIAAASERAYEAMLWSLAKPSDIHRALEFIGLPAGAPYNPAQLRFRARGERVVCWILDGDAPDAEPTVRIEELILDTRTEETLPETSFIFTGSMRIDSPTGGTERIYVADTYDPQSIVPAYSEPTSVLDIPWLADKGEVYQFQVANPDLTFTRNKIVMLRFEPEKKGGPRRDKDLVLEIGDDMSFNLKSKATGKVLNDAPNLESVLAVCQALLMLEHDPHVTLMFSGKLTLAAMKPVCTLMAMVDMETGVQIEPPPEGRLFYRAFMPNTSWRDPAGRMEQVWELHLTRAEGKLAGTMVYYDADWSAGGCKPELHKQSFDVADGNAIRSRLDSHLEERMKASRRPAPHVLLVFAPPDLRYQELLDFIRPALTTHKTVHLFLEE